ncbi:MAG: hypothetical protein VX899_24610 [Myxococcota bacterium]|nr:hypothetical protein [Myxococcota bacterium]
MSLLVMALLHASGVMNPPLYRLHGAACAQDVQADAIDPAQVLSFSGYNSGVTSCRSCGPDGTTNGHVWPIKVEQVTLVRAGDGTPVGAWEATDELCGPAPRLEFKGPLERATAYEIRVDGGPAVRFTTAP